ncbi:MAG: hypothetical protein II577_00225 [Erysipelotrichaceae bacterium]|nr:hypothetical protein [Erysipelotrichaceae bacterium]
MDNRKIGYLMGILMGGTISFVNSLIGTLSSGRFTVGGFLNSFLISFVISQILGLIIPIKKISDSLIKKLDLQPGTLKARIVDALVTDLVYSPLMTFIMVYMAWSQATAHGAKIPFGPMLLRSECISFVAAFFLSLFLSPVYLKLLMKNNKKL